MEKQTVDVQLRIATVADLALLSHYMKGLRQDDPMPAVTMANDAESVEAMSRLMDDRSLGRVWIIDRDHAANGYVVLAFVHSIEFGGRCAFVDELYVAPENRGKGVGRRTLELIADECRRLEVRSLLLEVSPSNERARRLYESAGFAERKYQLVVQRIRRFDEEDAK